MHWALCSHDEELVDVFLVDKALAEVYEVHQGGCNRAFHTTEEKQRPLLVVVVVHRENPFEKGTCRSEDDLMRKNLSSILSDQGDICEVPF